MDQSEPEIREYVEKKSRMLLARSQYRKLKATVDQWDSEERGKAKIVFRAVASLLAWLLLYGLFASIAPRYAYLGFFIGFPAWVIYVFYLIHKHLARR